MSQRNAAISRRAFIRSACIVTGAALIGAGCDFGPDMPDVARHLIKLLAHHDSAKQIGYAYREGDSTLRELSLPQLTASIIADIELDIEQWPGIPMAQTRELFVAKVREDFTLEHVVSVNGWLLSKTEAKLCAFLSMYYASEL